MWRSGGLSSLRGPVPLPGVRSPPQSASPPFPQGLRAPLLEVRPSPFSNEGALSHKPKEEASFSVTSPPGGRLQHVDSKGPVFQDTLEMGNWPWAERVKRFQQ